MLVPCQDSKINFPVLVPIYQKLLDFFFSQLQFTWKRRNLNGKLNVLIQEVPLFLWFSLGVSLSVPKKNLLWALGPPTASTVTTSSCLLSINSWFQNDITKYDRQCVVHLVSSYSSCQVLEQKWPNGQRGSKQMKNIHHSDVMSDRGWMLNLLMYALFVKKRNVRSFFGFV